MREADRRKDEFLALLSHELRNPLAPILTAAQLMQLRGDVATPHEREVILRQAAAPGAAGRRPARRVARGARKGHAHARSRSSSRAWSRRRSRRRRRCSSSGGTSCTLSVPPSGLADRGGRGPPHAGGQQPADERRALHAARRAHRGDGRARGRRGRAARARQRHRHRPEPAAARVRDVRAGRARPRPRAGRARPRPVAGAHAHRRCTAAR